MCNKLISNGLHLKPIKKIEEKNDYTSFISKISKLQACLNFIQCQNQLDSIVIGIENLNQLKDIVYLLKIKSNKEYPKKIISNKKNFFDPRRW